jgi:hypothetical protein
VITSFGHVLVRFAVVVSASLSSPLLAQPRTPPSPQDATPVFTEVPSNVRVDDVLQPLVAALLAKSPTLRRQWTIIGTSPLVRVSVLSRMGWQVDGSARARAEISRFAHGSVRARIEIPVAADLTELLPHELEHVLEQLDGLDLPALARRRDQGVVELHPGVYETDRAKAAGLKALHEVYGAVDPTVEAAFKGVKRLFRVFGGQPSEAPGAAGDRAPARVRSGTAGRAHLHKLR